MDEKLPEYTSMIHLIKKKIMEAHQILQSGFLDILFDGRNKSYGAYDLRKTYNQRISRALLATLSFMLVLMISQIISK